MEHRVTVIKESIDDAIFGDKGLAGVPLDPDPEKAKVFIAIALIRLADELLDEAYGCTHCFPMPATMQCVSGH